MTTPQPRPSPDVRRARDRFVTETPWRHSAHSFSFGRHYDAGNISYGVLLAHNDEVVGAGAGFPTHPHRDMEIVTWVLQGSLVHQDSTGHCGIIRPGLAQRMSAGTGILHSESNDAWRLLGDDAHDEPVHFVQMWVAPDGPGGTPGYEQRDVEDQLLGGGLVPVVSGMARHRRAAAAVGIGNRHVALHAARLPPGASVQLPEAPHLHLFVARGEVQLEGAGGLAAGDAVRLTATGGQRVTAIEPAEVLVWEMHAGLAA